MASTLNQLPLFMAAIYVGFIVGVLFDICALLRRVFRAKRVILTVLDALFLLCATAAVFVSLYFINGGEMRFYMLLAVAIGFGIYYATISKLFSILLDKLEKAIKAIAKRLKNSALYKKLFES